MQNISKPGTIGKQQLVINYHLIAAVFSKPLADDSFAKQKQIMYAGAWCTHKERWVKKKEKENHGITVRARKTAYLRTLHATWP